jgi:hypothetical protein
LKFKEWGSVGWIAEKLENGGWKKKMPKRTNENGGKTERDAVLKGLGEAQAIFENCQQYRLPGWIYIYK